MPHVTAIVVTYESARVIGACLASLKGQADAVIVADNASLDDSAAIAERDGARVLRLGANLGYGVANNRAIAAAEGATWCLIVNPDVTLEAGCVAALLAAVDAHPNAVILVPQLVEPDGRLFFRSESVLSPCEPVMPILPEPPATTTPIGFISGACLLVDRGRFLEIGGFDPAIFLFQEDDDLSLRVRRAGQTILFVPDARARHLRGGSSAPKPGATYLSRFHQAWSRAYIARKYGLSDDSFAVTLRNGLKFVGAALTFNRRRMERYAGSCAGAWTAWRGRPHGQGDGSA